jgi:D-alanyl-D-alanine carboxypeptidase
VGERLIHAGTVAGGREDVAAARRTGLAAAAGALAAAAVLLFLPPAATADLSGDSCRGSEIRTAAGCRDLAEAGREVENIVRQSLAANDLKAVLARVDVRNRTIAALSPGESMAGAPANLRMHFRIGSIAIPYLVDLLLQLQDRGRLSLDDPVSKWFPDLPNADAVTLRMLASASSGYPDWVQGNDSFQAALLADPFRQWTSDELLENAFAQPLICDPGACFHYAHTGFVILGRVVQEVTGKPVGTLIRSRVFRRLGIDDTRISALPAMPQPVLHAYVNERGFYEDATYWSPSWGISGSLLMSSTIGDVIRSAKALGAGALVSRRAQRQRVAPVTVGLHPGFSDSLYYGLGILVANGWLFQNPELNGYTSIMAVLPSRRISIALSVTEGESAAQTPTNFSERLLGEVTEYLTPQSPAALPSG